MHLLHLNKVSSQGETIDHVFKPWRYKSNLKETVIGLLFLFHLGNCLTTISIAQTSSSLAIEFDACILMLCGDLENQCYIQTKAGTIYLFADHALFT
jgi:hypothetical protein